MVSVYDCAQAILMAIKFNIPSVERVSLSLYKRFNEKYSNTCKFKIKINKS